LVDIHSHIIPAFDDGVRDLEESMSLMDMEVQGGTRTIVATPHVTNVQELRDSGVIVERSEMLNAELQNRRINMRVISGAELYPSTIILPALDSNKPITVGGHRKHVLLDLPLGAFPNDLSTLIYEIQSRGICPILAHPERTGPVQFDINVLQGLLERGAVCQVNAGSLYGRYGEVAAKVGRKILENQWAHFLASDAHRPGSKPILERGCAEIADRVSPEYLHYITAVSGDAIVNGRTLPERPALVARKPEPKSWAQRLFGKK
jgi:protein-tyrosine phosphatase